MRKLVVLLTLGFLCLGSVAIAAWTIVDNNGDQPKAGTTTVEQGQTFQSELAEATTADGAGNQEGGAAQDQAGTHGESDGQSEPSGEDFSYTEPEQRYVTETQRHQNFFIALAEGRIMSLDITSTDYRPVGDPDTSYVNFTIGTDSGTSNAIMVFKYENSMWRIAAINQLQGDLSGGTNYMVPSSFEDDLRREIEELQPFLAKVAEGRLESMSVDSVSRPGENETILYGQVVGKSGKTVPAEMHMRKDYGLWHITSVTNPP